MVTTTDAREWVLEAVKYYRSMGFFQNRTDYGIVNKTRKSQGGQEDDDLDRTAPVFPVWFRNKRLPAFGLMTDEEIADFARGDTRLIETFLKSGGAREFDVPIYLSDGAYHSTYRETRSSVELSVVINDPFRVFRESRDYIIPVLESEYVDFVVALARISRGTFAPTDITTWREPNEEGDLNYGTMHLAFTHHQRKYEILTGTLRDWLNDEPMVRGVNALLAREDAPYRFYYWWKNDEHFALVVLTPDEKTQLERDRGWDFMVWRGQEVGAANEAHLIDKGEAP